MPYTNNVPTPPAGGINPETAAQVMISVVGKLLARPEVLTRGQLLDDAVIILLKIRKTGWSGEGGSGGGEGEADIRWQCKPSGEILTAFGSALRSR